MSSLSVYHESSPDLPNKVLTHLEDIASTLAAHGVRFERWPAAAPIAPGASPEQLLGAYQAQIDRLLAEGNYREVELIAVTDDQPLSAESAGRLPEEQRLAADQAHCFVVGRGLFCLHIDDYVYAVSCEKSDLLAIPAGTRHWFDQGEHPHFIAIRLSGDARGGAAELSGDDFASSFPRLDD